LPHVGVSHFLSCFRIGRELVKQGWQVRVFGSDVARPMGLGHSETWGGMLERFGMKGKEMVHQSATEQFGDWVVRQGKELGLDVLILDAVWQGLAFACAREGAAKRIVVHHAGLPDFRSADMPAWRFVHPGHPRQRWEEARRELEALEISGGGLRGFMSSIQAMSAAGSAAPGAFEFGCGEYANVPAVRAMSLCPGMEFDQERGRVEYFGTLLHKTSDVDWMEVGEELGGGDGGDGLIVCAFGTTAIHGKEENQWLLSVAVKLARSMPTFRVVAVLFETELDWSAASGVENLFCYPWVPLWELLAGYQGKKVLVTAPGVGAFREATASGTAMVAIPRVFDQFGAAARVEYFGLGEAIVSERLPEADLIVRSVQRVLGDSEIESRVETMRREVERFDATEPLKGFMEKVGSSQWGKSG